MKDRLGLLAAIRHCVEGIEERMTGLEERMTELEERLDEVIAELRSTPKPSTHVEVVIKKELEPR